MRRFLYSFAVAACAALASAAPAAAQHADTAFVAASRQALRTVLQAVTAMGGWDRLTSLQRIARELVGVRPDRGQGDRPDRPDNAPVHLVSARDFHPARAAEFLEWHVRGGLLIRNRTMSDGHEFFGVIYQNGTVIPLPAARAPLVLQAQMRRHPETLLLGALRRPEALRLAAERRVGARRYAAVTFADVDGTVLDLLFDRRTHLLARVVAAADDPIRGDAAAEVVYEDYRQFGSLTLPGRYIDLIGGDTTSDVRVTKLLVDAAVDDSLFGKPASFAPVAEYTAQPTLRPLGNDVYMVTVPGPYNSAFVVFRDYVLLLEAPLNSTLQEATIGLIRSVAADKPIRYVVVTHFHSDHIGGVRPYIARGATIVAPATAATVVLSLAARPHELRPDSLARAPRTPIIDTLTGNRVFSDDAHRVELYLLSPMPHVAEMVIAYLPGNKLLFEADLFDGYQGEQVPGTDDGVELKRRLTTLGLTVDQIIPVHGVVSTMADFDRGLDLRGAAGGPHGR